MKNKLRNSFLLFTFALAGIYFFNSDDRTNELMNIEPEITVKTNKKTQDERMLFSEEREMHEFNMQKNPVTGKIPLEEKEKEYLKSLDAKEAKENASTRVTTSTYTSRGPTNFGGRTRALAVDISDGSSNTILAGGVSSGMFRTTNGGSSWTKVSANDEIHNVTALAQDPRSGFQNIWYYATGEVRGNSASLGSPFRGLGVWKSIDSGLTWTQIAVTNSVFESFDSDFDYNHSLEVNPITGDLFIAADAGIYRYDGITLTLEISASSGINWGYTDVVIAGNGRVFAALEGTTDVNGVWTSPTGDGSWTNIASNGSPAAWSAVSRIMLASAPSNDDIIYALFMNGASGIDADLWHYDFGTSTWTDYTSKMPDEVGGDLFGNDPFTGQIAYDLVVSVKPDDADFVVIGGSNAYKIEDIVNDAEFLRIGGYASNANYALYANHHPDIHVLEFDPNNSSILFSGTDGGVHRTANIAASSISWTSLNNNYQTYQYYHVAMDDTNGSNAVIGGAQDNGTTIGGTDIGLVDNTTMSSWYSGDGVGVGITRRNGGANFQFYYGSQSGDVRTNYPGFRSIAPAGSSSQFVTYFYLDPASTNALYYAGLSTLYMTTDAENVTTAINASNWTNMGSVSPSQNLRSFATTWGAYSAASYLLIGGENGRVFKLDDPQNAASLASAVDVTPTGASTAAGSVVSGLAVHPTNPDIAMAVYANYGITSIYVTTNLTTTATWTLVERNLSAHSIRSAAIAEVGGETIYFAGTARGLYSSDDPTTKDWEIEGPNEVGFSLVSGLVYRPSDSKLLIGTHGNGMYETTVENTLSVNSYTEVDNKIKLYPNPAQSEINFKSNNFTFTENTNYSIIDISGKIVASGIVNNKKVDVSGLNSGLYFVSVSANGLKQTLKFIKK